MGERGPTAEEGSHRHSDPVELEPGGGWSIVPTVPTDLRPSLQEQWTAYFESPVSRALAPVDLYVVERLFRLYELLESAYDEIEREGFSVEGNKGWKQLNPAVGAVNMLEKTCMQIEKQLGISPMGRARLGIKASEVQRASKAAAAAARKDPIEVQGV